MIKEVQDTEKVDKQHMTANSNEHKGVVEKCKTWQQNIREMENTADGPMLQKLKKLKTEIDQLVLHRIPDVPSTSYRNKKHSDTEISNLFGELQYR